MMSLRAVHAGTGYQYLLRSVAMLPPEVQVVLCAGAPDTPEIAREVADAVAELQKARDGVIWIEQMLPRAELIARAHRPDS